MDTLPLTGNGKVDRHALPEPDAATAAAEYVAPRTATETALAAIWEELLGVNHVGVEDGFFALGGHSLLATRVLSRVREAFGVEVPLRAVFESATLGALAAKVETIARTGGVTAPPIVPVDHSGDLPLSFAQERLWRLERSRGGSRTYMLGSVYRLSGALDTSALERALGEIVRRHEALRTIFPEVDGEPVQRVLPFTGFHLPTHDVSLLAGDERAPAAERIARAIFDAPFDLLGEPLLRTVLVRVDEGEHLFAFNVHHIIADGWSLAVFYEELRQAYGAYVEAREPSLPALPLQMGDYAAWQRTWPAGEELERLLAFWRKTLAGAPPLLALPTDRPRGDKQDFGGAAEILVLTAGEAAAIQALGSGEGATLFMTLLAALSLVLADASGQDDVMVGTPMVDRKQSETERVFGFFLNYLALRTDVSGDPSFRELLRRARETTLDAYAHQDIPFERLVAALQLRRSQSHAAVFQVLLNVLNYGEGAMDFAGLEVEAFGRPDEQTSKYDLTLYVMESPAGMVLRLVYASELFTPERVRTLLARFRAVLAHAAAAPDAPVSRISALADSDLAASPAPSRPSAGA
jgi:acyl carrier protein